MKTHTWKEITEAQESLETKKARINWMAYTIYFFGGLFMVDLIINVIR
jgi:hypothetical protein